MRTLAALPFALPILVSGQSLVNLNPQGRTALLEDFTGIHCGYCPDGHAIAAALKEAHPNDLVVVGVHAGPYAVPSGSEPDFRTVPGTDIDAHFTIGGYPAGVINRHLFNGADDLGRGAWEGAVNEILGYPSPVNIGVESSFDAGTRDLTVNVALLYTANSPIPGNDYISVLLKESHIIGWQTDYGPAGNHPNYDHTNVLRAYLTDTWGDEVTTTDQGDMVFRTYTLNVPVEWDIANCDVVAFISEYQSEVYQAREIKADGGTTLVIGELDNISADHAAGQNGTGGDFNSSFDNLLGADADYLVTLSSDDQPLDWSAGFALDGTPYAMGTQQVTVVFGSPMSITVTVTPGASAAIANYLLTVASVDEPNAPILSQDYHVISGVTDLVISNPQAEPWQPLYDQGLTLAGNTHKASTSRNELIAFGEVNALSGVNNIYHNVSWTFPSLTDESVAVLADFLDQGGNLMIAGQDIGWDQSGDPNAYGTAQTQAFYQNYMYADFVADGSTSNSSVDFIDADLVFGGVPTSGINDVFAGNNYPEEITPLTPASAIMNYNGNPAKIGGLRVQTGAYKLVYFGTGPEQMNDANVALSMIQLSHDWFYGIVGVDELDEALAALLGQAYPSPAAGTVTIPFTGLDQDAELRLIDATGRMVLQRSIARGLSQLTLDVRTLDNGVYQYELIGANGARAARTLQVMH